MPHPTRAPALPIERIVKRMVRRDPMLEPYADSIRRRLNLVDATQTRLTGGRLTLADFAAGHEYFGLHRRGNQWVLREWAPNATRILLVGDATDWKEAEPFALTRKNEDGVWELRLPKKSLRHGDLFRLRAHWRGGRGDRIPAWAPRFVQDPATLIFNAQVWHPETAFPWQHPRFRRKAIAPLIYEVHPGAISARITTRGRSIQRSTITGCLWILIPAG